MVRTTAQRNPTKSAWHHENNKYAEWSEWKQNQRRRREKDNRKMAKKKKRAIYHVLFQVKGDDWTKEEKREIKKALNSHQWNATKARASELGYNFF